MPDEEIQEIGREGVAIIKRWLEATTFIELPWDAYHHKFECTVEHLAGHKKLDLSGHFLTGQKEPLLIESKHYKSTGRQFKEFQKLLAIAYSAAHKELEGHSDYRRRHFMWVTFHPFNLENWPTLETHEQICRALTDHPEYLPEGRTVNEDLVRDVATRITVLVFNRKQEQLSLTREELQKFRTVVDRKAKEL